MGESTEMRDIRAMATIEIESLGSKRMGEIVVFIGGEPLANDGVGCSDQQRMGE